MAPTKRYRDLLTTSSAWKFFAVAWIGRVGIAMTTLSLVWMVHDARGSFAIAGLITGCFALAEAVVGPQVARLVDTYGQSRVLPLQSVVHASIVALLCVAAYSDTPTATVCAAAIATGATIPQFGALSATRWAFLLKEEPKANLTAAFSLESIANSLAFMAGPVIVSTLGAQGLSLAAQLSAALCICAAGLLLSTLKQTDPGSSGTSKAPVERGGKGDTGFPVIIIAVIAMNLAIGIFFGSNQVAVTGFTISLGAPEMAPVVFLCASCAGLAGATLYGRIASAKPAHERLVRVSLGLALTSLALPFAPSVAILIPMIIFCELFVPPTLVNLNVLMEGHASQRKLTQAFTWANSASAAGSAIASASAGALVDHQGPSGGFFVLATGTTLVFVIALLVWASLFHQSRRTEQG